MITALEQLKIIFLYILLGLFVSSTFDSFSFLVQSFKQIFKYILELIYWLLVTYISVSFIIKNTAHYVTLYSILFFIIGVFIYYCLISKHYLKHLNILKSSGKKMILFLYPLLFPLELVKFLINKRKKDAKVKKP